MRNAGENCPAKYLANESVEQLYPLNNIESTARALYSQPKLFWEVFGPFFKNLLVNCLDFVKFVNGANRDLPKFLA